MSKLNGKAKEVLDACLVAESSEVKAKVYEIVALSGLDPSDPMFLVLALTGQMRVLLEVAPAELSQLLRDCQEQTTSSLQSMQQVVKQIAVTRVQEAATMKRTLEGVAQQCGENLLQVGMAATSAIAEANQEVLHQSIATVKEAQQLKDEMAELRAVVEKNRLKSEEVTQALLKRVEETTAELKTSISNIKQSYTALHKLQSNLEWLQLGKWLSPMMALVAVGGLGLMLGVWVREALYNTPDNVYARNLYDWNNERLIKCQADHNPKCTIWLKQPPEK